MNFICSKQIDLKNISLAEKFTEQNDFIWGNRFFFSVQASSMMQCQIDELVNVLKDAGEQVTEIEKLQSYLTNTRTELCNVVTT